ncbi:hypothetical protein BX616_010586 [Lobosporangium transversale]|uniref:Integral peroxisomal membrane peroxin-domain-containing protein n=1 Tax=Lobosporangium transversale TaxID=64571 RepID=A0A1Y2GI21_9FUNG|nr:integral peroxisomal membrane peroxin-domain-containing protein [Lobosporangium transversale]KAF9911459.1 hypothetical protein BX616_010586 [Lobosporangium transversale]ORZ10327.1 integral peroxisomal membrane peroxin-domain-containing protein [Lobosporangium transversale]|eukprot:XP_021879234.1 integral peroxisomal membrane peroxin-domain-containing protein [Lobosporangium transversale]
MRSTHKFHEKTFTKLTYCDYCTKLLWGVAKQGVSCEGCHFNCHKKCSELVYDNCIRPMYAPARDDLQRSMTVQTGRTGDSKSTSTVITKKAPSRRRNSEGTHASIPPAIVSSSQPMQSLVEKKYPRRSEELVRTQDKDKGDKAEPQQQQQRDRASSPEPGRTSFLEDAIISAAIRMTFPADISALPKNEHPPLTIQATTINFTKFVQKTTPVFWFQDRVEDIFMWKDPWNTMLVLVIYCFICIYPILLFLMPQTIMAITMIYFFQQKSARQQQKILGIKPPGSSVHLISQQQQLSPEEAYIEAQEKRHHNRYHVYHDEDYLEQDSSSDDEEERQSTSMQYLSNMQHIQNMMGDYTDAHDALRLLFKHLDWSDEAEAIAIVQGIIVAFVGMSLIMWFVPWRWVFMVGGASAMLANSPWGKIIVKECIPLSKDLSAWAKVQAQAYKQKHLQES